mgnify:CR=1 FL=1
MSPLAGARSVLVGDAGEGSRAADGDPGCVDSDPDCVDGGPDGVDGGPGCADGGPDCCTAGVPVPLCGHGKAWRGEEALLCGSHSVTDVADVVGRCTDDSCVTRIPPPCRHSAAALRHDWAASDVDCGPDSPAAPFEHAQYETIRPSP